LPCWRSISLKTLAALCVRPPHAAREVTPFLDWCWHECRDQLRLVSERQPGHPDHPDDIKAVAVIVLASGWHARAPDRTVALGLIIGGAIATPSTASHMARVDFALFHLQIGARPSIGTV